VEYGRTYSTGLVELKTTYKDTDEELTTQAAVMEQYKSMLEAAVLAHNVVLNPQLQREIHDTTSLNCM